MFTGQHVHFSERSRQKVTKSSAARSLRSTSEPLGDVDYYSKSELQGGGRKTISGKGTADARRTPENGRGSLGRGSDATTQSDPSSDSIGSSMTATEQTESKCKTHRLLDRQSLAS